MLQTRSDQIMQVVWSCDRHLSPNDTSFATSSQQLSDLVLGQSLCQILGIQNDIVGGVCRSNVGFCIVAGDECGNSTSGVEDKFSSRISPIDVDSVDDFGILSVDLCRSVELFLCHRCSQLLQCVENTILVQL